MLNEMEFKSSISEAIEPVSIVTLSTKSSCSWPESVETVREIVEEARVVKPLDNSLHYACQYTKLSQELLECVIGTCPKSFNERDNKAPSTPVTRKKQVTFSNKPGPFSSNTQKHKVHQRVQQTNIPVISSTGVNDSTEASGSKPRSNTNRNRILPTKKENKKEVEVRLRTNNHGMCFVNILNSVNATPTVRIVLNKEKQIWKPKGKLFDNRKKLTLGKRDCGSQWRPTGKKFALGELLPVNLCFDKCSTLYANQQVRTGLALVYRLRLRKHMMGELFKVMIFCGKVHRGVISGFYYVEGLGDTSILCRAIFVILILEVGLQKDTLLRYACCPKLPSPNPWYIWHRRLNQFKIHRLVIDSCRKDLVRGLPRLKLKRIIFALACQLGKSKKFSHRPKSENSNMEVLYTLHMDMCSPMRVQSIKGKKYILVIGMTIQDSHG
ncbi:hypothetical protein Tco_0394842 [Tanacetum coccineum]